MNNFNILDELKNTKFNNNNNKQINIIFDIFYKLGYNKKISKRKLETIYSINYLNSQLKNKNKNINFNDLSNYIFLNDEQLFIPGDVDRNIRLFYNTYNKYGLIKENTKNNIEYYWINNITNNDYNNLNSINIIPRNLFKNSKDKNLFIKSKNNCCELCKNNLRLSIDHWRAYSKYHINNINIAVLLCEKCNNIHHNYDASNIIVKYKYNLDIINNWINIETKIRNYGFLPNKEDIIQQNNNIIYVLKYLQSIGYNNSKLYSMIIQ